MNIILLKDIEDGNVDAIIKTKTTTAEEIQNIIDKVKSEVEDWTDEDIFNALPEDCKAKRVPTYDNEVSVWY